MQNEPNTEIVEYVKREIIPQYRNFDRAHNVTHAEAVIAESLRLSAHYEVNINIVYITAACHDLGLRVDRETHHTESAKIIRNDAMLRKWFSDDEINLIAEAVEDHRASNRHEPRSIYGRIVAEADRQIEPIDIIRRAVEFGIDQQPELDKEQQWQRVRAHMHEKYAEGGYMKLYIPESNNAKGLAELRDIIADEPQLRKIFERFYQPKPISARCQTSAGCPDYPTPAPYSVRKATAQDLNIIMQMVNDSRELMRQNGNATQWVNGYPSREIILNDISNGNGYIIYNRPTLSPIAYFAFIIGEEPTYNIIVGGEWSDPDKPYGTIHRLARKNGCSGVTQKCLEYCKSQISHLRADTHRDNATVQHLLEREGFSYRGIIYVSDGTERLAYQWSNL